MKLGMKLGSRKAALMEQDVRRALRRKGLTLAVRWPRSGRTVTAHWLIDRGGVRVMDYWPATGRWWAAALNRRGETTLLDLVAVAEGLAREIGGPKRN
jgi:hypothetical protein